MVREFIVGVRYFIRGARIFVTSPSLWPYGAIPILIAGVLFVGLSTIAFPYLNTALEEGLRLSGAADAPSSLWEWASYGFRQFIRVAAWLALLTLLLLVFPVVVNFVAAPFNDLLAARLERDLGVLAAGGGFRAATVDLLRGIAHSVALLVLFVSLMWIALPLIGLIPVVGILFDVVVAPALAAWFLAFEFVDVVMSRRRLGFMEKFRVLGREPALFLGFGAATLLPFMVPVVNFLAIPFAVTGATLLYLERVEGASRVVPFLET